MLQAMLRWGKHAGRAFADVAATDWPYVASVLREKAEGKRVPCELKAFANYIHVVHGGVLEVGKQRGRFVHDVLLDDQHAHLSWLSMNLAIYSLIQILLNTFHKVVVCESFYLF